MHTLNNLRSDQGALRNDTLEGDHSVQVGGTERPRALEGIVTKCSLVRPKIIQSVHWSERGQKFLTRKYIDATMTASGATSMSIYPQESREIIRFRWEEPSVLGLQEYSPNAPTKPQW
jgi:hypothetical protein